MQLLQLMQELGLKNNKIRLCVRRYIVDKEQYRDTTAIWCYQNKKALSKNILLTKLSILPKC
jgi:hypothetical protein